MKYYNKKLNMRICILKIYEFTIKINRKVILAKSALSSSIMVIPPRATIFNNKRYRYINIFILSAVF